MPFEHPNNRKEGKENERKTDEGSLTTQLTQEQNDFLSLLHNKARKHLLNFRTILEKKKGEKGKEEWNTLVTLLSRIEKQLESELHIEGNNKEEASVLANKLVIYFREGADKTEEGTFQEDSYYVQLLRDSINEVGVEKFFSTPTLSIKKCIEEHHRKKEVLLDAKYETDAGTVVLDNLEYVTKDEETGEEVVHHCKLIRAEDPGHLKRATKYASVNSHVCVGDDTQSYGKKLNLPTNQNGIEIYFLWEDDGSEGGIYHQIISYNKKNKSIEQMKGVDNEMVKNDDAYFPALLEALKALNREKGGLRKVADTANLRVRENYVLTDEGEVPLSEVEGDEFVLKVGKLNFERKGSVHRILDIFRKRKEEEEKFVKSVNNYLKLKNISLPFEITKREEIALAKEEIDENTRYYRGDLKPEDVEIFKRIKGPIYIEGDVDMHGTDITEIPKRVSFGGTASFYGCAALTTISEGVSFGLGAGFYGCTSLTTISEGISFGVNADFSGCTSLTKETIEKLKQWKAEGKIPGTLWLPDGTKIY